MWALKSPALKIPKSFLLQKLPNVVFNCGKFGWLKKEKSVVNHE